MSSEVSSPLHDAQLTPEEQLAANNAQIAANRKRIRELGAKMAASELAAINGRIALMKGQIKHDKAAAAVLAAVQ